ncbi:hypothetical protein Gbro_4942 (plasmid) [Gordonia bronchialis DSM 43247]|uniref:Transposase IS3/IS911 family protein n=1 Tax=Gordonia bronchialis (strain ATCC 25592 / DSM 43247 / BCRC 13721 / JCM 3198 / KCTC 3076 / NBRC 16047 / NCTC 10667) TaxID=526226 RepID=D0LFK6_GORB4|nr:transposase [Gordonia bronchialis]ACY24055.1 hypothetical protein Gbro_4942 [Gordonia bronchialis DSM 43247]MCC3326060.1 hypothetical protein [Gordonia bronchialis]QGS27302.1 hypothetical protein FOB84_24270 [Gordonia bronchialis]STS10783.1 Uncharacterised protein [Gordonia bronchialis]
MSPRRMYSSQFRATCLELVTDNLRHQRSREAAIVAVATAVGVPITTLRNWVRDAWGPAREPDTDRDTALVLGQLQRENDTLRRANRALSRLADTTHLIGHHPHCDDPETTPL